MMYQPPSIDAENRTLQQLLEFTEQFGLRYCIWQEEKSYTPSELLAHLKSDPLLQQVCEVWEADMTRASKKVFAWQIRFVTRNSASDPSPYLIEDRLTIPRVLDWLEQRKPKEIVAILQPGERLSTFLATYYQDQLDVQAEHLSDARLPIWYDYMESLIYSLDPDEHREQPVKISAVTLAYWISLIVDIFGDGRHDNVELDDGTSEIPSSQG
jgi:hypothetical protein